MFYKKKQKLKHARSTFFKKHNKQNILACPSTQAVFLSNCEILKSIISPNNKSVTIHHPDNKKNISKKVSSHLNSTQCHQSTNQSTELSECKKKFKNRSKHHRKPQQYDVFKNEFIRKNKMAKESRKTLKIQGKKCNEKIQKENNLDKQKFSTIHSSKKTSFHPKSEEKTKNYTIKLNKQSIKENNKSNYLKLFVQSVKINYSRGLQSYKTMMNFDFIPTKVQVNRSKTKRPNTSSGYSKIINNVRSNSSSFKVKSTREVDSQKNYESGKSTNRKFQFFLTCSK